MIEAEELSAPDWPATAPAPPSAPRAAPCRERSPEELLGLILAVTPPAQRAPGLALALLEHPLRGAHLLLLRQRADRLRRRLVEDTVTLTWVKLGFDGARAALTRGCNDLGGALMDEHITTMAGALGGTSQTPETPEALERAARRHHCPVRQRTTHYGRP